MTQRKGRHAKSGTAPPLAAKAGSSAEQEAGSERPILGSAERSAMIAQAAYYRAAQRDFAPGHELEDWLAAEAEIDTTLMRDEAPAGALEKLRRERDELRVKMHLARLDVRQEWDALERKWEVIKTRSGGALKEARGAGKDVGSAMRVLMGEIHEGYKRIRGAL